jgi:hypothetical protein
VRRRGRGNCAVLHARQIGLTSTPSGHHRDRYQWPDRATPSAPTPSTGPRQTGDEADPASPRPQTRQEAGTQVGPGGVQQQQQQQQSLRGLTRVQVGGGIILQGVDQDDRTAGSGNCCRPDRFSNSPTAASAGAENVAIHAGSNRPAARHAAISGSGSAAGSEILVCGCSSPIAMVSSRPSGADRR